MFKWLLFDADNTLLDFSKASKDSLWITFEQFGRQCSDEIYDVYKKVNGEVWADFEQNKITAEDLRPKRFEMLFEKIEETGLSPLEFSVRYLENIVQTSEAYEGVPELLEELKSKYKISIVTNGLREVQRPRLERLDLMKHFDSVVVSDEIGVAKPHIDYFHHVYQSIHQPPVKEEILIVGDNLASDIQGGINFGIHTCWLNHGKPNQTKIKPHFEIDHIHGISDLLKS
jgi:YjjG family noncanonical pyrimidine nucleotidase